MTLGSLFWTRIPGAASAINLEVMNWSEHYKTDREFGYLQINYQATQHVLEGSHLSMHDLDTVRGQRI